jgi:hypothetical protein
MTRLNNKFKERVILQRYNYFFYLQIFKNNFSIIVEKLFYFAKLTARVSRITVTFTCPG